MASQDDVGNSPNGLQSTQVSNSQELGDTLASFQIIENPVQMECPAETSTPSDNENQEGVKCIPIQKPKETLPVHSIPLVLPDEELECLLLASIELCKKGTVVHMGVCQYQFQGIKISFTKILTDDASWRSMTDDSIRSNCEKLIELCVMKLQEDWLSLLDSLAVVFDPANKFLEHNKEKEKSDTSSLGEYAHSINGKPPQGWLVDFINRFGGLRGFDILLERFQSKRNLTIPVIHAVIRPFRLCIDFLTVHTLVTYFLPIVRITIDVLNESIDDEFKNEVTSDKILEILKISKILMMEIPNHQSTEIITELNTLEMIMILRILKVSSFNGKMSALTEVNDIIITIKSSRDSTEEKRDCITAENLIQWIKGNEVLEIILGDSLNQPEYVDKLETIVQFMIDERALTLKDLDTVWIAQAGKHEAIVKNVHDLFTNLARHFSLGQLDHLFKCLKTSFKTADNDYRKQLLDLMKRLAENNEEVIHKVLALLWDVAHWGEVPTEIMKQALNVHVEILKTQTDGERTIWLDKCVKELSDDDWVLPALKQIHAICLLYNKNLNPSDGVDDDRGKAIDRLVEIESIRELVTESLVRYMAKDIHQKTPKTDPITLMSDNRYNHMVQVEERLNFLSFVQESSGEYCILNISDASIIWKCLAERGLYESDREICFKWFSKSTRKHFHWDSELTQQFFENNILKLDPALLTQSGIQCYGEYFITVNLDTHKLSLGSEIFAVKDVNLIGIEYLWKIVRNSPEEIGKQGIEFLTQIIQHSLQFESWYS